MRVDRVELRKYNLVAYERSQSVRPAVLKFTFSSNSKHKQELSMIRVTNVRISIK
jgi:hypothetical protein